MDCTPSNEATGGGLNDPCVERGGHGRDDAVLWPSLWDVTGKMAPADLGSENPVMTGRVTGALPPLTATDALHQDGDVGSAKRLHRNRTMTCEWVTAGQLLGG
jgi:hypothetical protein